MDTRVATEQVIVFGASTSGQRALERLCEDPAVEVVAFADNAASRQGTTFLGRPIIAPADLLNRDFDRIVVASHAWRQIVPQLRSLGVPTGRVELFRLSADVFAPVPSAVPTRPRLLLLTDDCVSLSHGTGALLLRTFAEYPPEHLIHAYLTPRGDAALPHSYWVAPDASRAHEHGSPLSATALVETIEAQHGPIDLVYSNVFGEAGLELLGALAGALGPSVPIVHHALDCLVQDGARFDDLLRTLTPRVARIWAIGPSLADRLARATGTMVTVVNPISGNPAATWKTEHRELSTKFLTVMVGNVYTPSVAARLKTIWAELMRRDGLGPIRWFAHPGTAQRLAQAGVTAAPEIEYCGLAVDGFLHEQLCGADMALLPFNVMDEPDERDPIGRYSIPSRLTEYLNAGLPVFAAAGRSTDAYRFMVGNGLAVCSSLADESRFTADLVAFMRDSGLRRQVGTAARRFFVERCGIEQYRARLLGEFDQLIAASRRGRVTVLEAVTPPPPPEKWPRSLAQPLSDRIHYACGRRVLDGWLNVDMFDEAYPYGPPDDALRTRIFYADLRAPHPFPDNVFQFAYAEDFLEHLSQADSLIFLTEAYRTLKTGGVLRLSTPGLPGILRRHLRSSDHAGASVCRAEAFTRWHHLHFYTFESLELVARHIGFSTVTRCDYGRSQYPVLEQDSRPDQRDLNLVVELTK